MNSTTRFDLYLKKVGKNIKAARLRSNLTQLDVAEKTGIEYRYYQRMEAGKVNMTLMSIYRLAKLFKIEIYLLTNGISAPPPTHKS